MFDARTGFLFLGILSLVVAIALWSVLDRKRMAGLDFWCGSVLVMGLSTLLLALRGLLPDVLGFSAANLGIYVALEMRAQALRMQLGEPEPYSRLLLGALAFLVVFEYLRIGLARSDLRFGFAVGLFALMSLRVTWWGWQLGRRHGYVGARWIAAASFLLAMSFVWRLAGLSLGLSESNVLTRDLDAVLMSAVGILSVICSNIGYLGIALEQSMRDRIQYTEAHARTEERLEAERRVYELHAAHSAELETRVRERTEELQLAMRRIEILSRTDDLTKLLNRRAFNDIFPREFARAQRESSWVAFCVLDLDHFKSYNDRYGHAAGDEVLRKISTILRQHLRRPGDYAFRLGGEEFGLLMASAETPEHSIDLIEQVRGGFIKAGIPHLDNESGVVTGSFGIAFSNGKRHETPEALYREADRALYRAKEAGRNRVIAAPYDGDGEAG